MNWAVSITMMVLQSLIVAYWVFAPAQPLLAAVALVAGLAMSGAAVLAVLLSVRAFRLDPADPLSRAELRDYATLTPDWQVAVLFNLGFTAIAARQGVWWIAAAVGAWLAAEISVTLHARRRLRAIPPETPPPPPPPSERAGP